MTAERAAIAVPPAQPARFAYQQASLWNTEPTNLLADRRAQNLGDLLTVVIEIDEEAEIRNSTQRQRGGSESVNVDEFFGIGGEQVPARASSRACRPTSSSARTRTSAATARSSATRS